jgi:hypothetical protein
MSTVTGLAMIGAGVIASRSRRSIPLERLAEATSLATLPKLRRDGAPARPGSIRIPSCVAMIAFALA